MGQKVNPHGLRVGVIKDWDSKWYEYEEESPEEIEGSNNYYRNSFFRLVCQKCKQYILFVLNYILIILIKIKLNTEKY